MYVTDYDNIDRGYIELTSSGGYDVEEICWKVQDYLKNPGWNELYLPLKDAITGEPAFNAKGLTYLRLYTIQKANAAAPMYFDDIYFVNQK